MTDHFVYLITDRLGDPVYVGKGSGYRAGKRGSRNAKVNALISFGGTLPPVKIREGMTQAEAFEVERALIAFHGRADLGLGTLLNLTDGGAGMANPCAETRAKISKGNLGKKMSPEAIEKTSAYHRGRPKSPEQVEKMRLARLGKPALAATAAAAKVNRGRKRSPEHCAAIADSLRGRKLSPEVIAKRTATRAANRLAKLVPLAIAAE